MSRKSQRGLYQTQPAAVIDVEIMIGEKGDPDLKAKSQKPDGVFQPKPCYFGRAT